MTNQELCTQYELIIALIKTGNADEAVRILENSIKRIDRGQTSSSEASPNNSQ